jgi:septal ring factor EnvC (AmiA/AmiB activator)
MRWIFAAAASVIAAGSSAFAIVLMLNAADAESELTAARAALSKTKAELSLLSDEVGAFREIHGSYQDVVANLEEVTKQLEDRRMVLADLRLKIDDARAELDSLRTEAKKYGEIPQGASRKYLTITRAKIRAGSSTTTSQVAIVSAGVPLSVYETVEDGTWHKIGLTGYMYHELLKPSP